MPTLPRSAHLKSARRSQLPICQLIITNTSFVSVPASHVARLAHIGVSAAAGSELSPTHSAYSKAQGGCASAVATSGGRGGPEEEAISARATFETLQCDVAKRIAQADEYLAHLVGHEGAGSLLSALKVLPLTPHTG